MLVVPSQSAVIPTSKREYTKQHTYSSCLELQALSDRISQQFHAKCLIAEASTFTSPENQFYSCYRFEQHLNTSQVILGFSIVVLLMFCANEHRNLERQSRICCYVKYGWKQCLIFGEEGTPSARLEWSRLKITRRKSVVSIFTMARSAIVIVSVSRLKSKQAEIPRNSTDVNKFNLHPFAKKKPFFLVWRLIKGNGRGCGEPITCTGRASP